MGSAGKKYGLLKEVNESTLLTRESIKVFFSVMMLGVGMFNVPAQAHKSKGNILKKPKVNVLIKNPNVPDPTPFDNIVYSLKKIYVTIWY